MPAMNMVYKYYFRVANRIACAGTTKDLFGTEGELRRSKPGWINGSIEISGWRTTPEDAAAWLRRQHADGIPTPQLVTS